MDKFKKQLKVAWTYFNRWRKKYWFTRFLIILLVFSPILYEKLRGHLIICDLVKYACDAIFSGGIPPYENALCKYYKIVEIKRLQSSIIVFADKNQNGVFDADEIEFLKSKGCDAGETQKPVLKANMDKLAGDAGKLGLLPPAYSTTQIRKNAFNAAHSETEFFFKPLTDSVYDVIARMNWLYPRLTEKQINELKTNYTEEQFRENPAVPDYRTWATWRNGLVNFLYGIAWKFGPMTSVTLWFSISIMLGLFSALTFKSHRKFMSVFASLIFVFFIGSFPTTLANNSDLYNLFALAIFSMVAGLIGFKISGYIENKIKWRILSALIVGFLLILWSFNLDSLFFHNPYFLFYDGIGRLVSPVTVRDFSGITPQDAFSLNSAIFATILIIVSLGFLCTYYQEEILDFFSRLKRR
jgi:hypothetical protein